MTALVAHGRGLRGWRSAFLISPLLHGLGRGVLRRGGGCASLRRSNKRLGLARSRLLGYAATWPCRATRRWNRCSRWSLVRRRVSRSMFCRSLRQSPFTVISSERSSACRYTLDRLFITTVY